VRKISCLFSGLPHMYRSTKANEKYSVLTPFNVVQKILGPYMFSATSRDTLNDKIELYFHDYSFVPLFIQVGPIKL
jgi:replication factor C subunit 1